MKAVRYEEHVARLVIQGHLATPVVHHDHGSAEPGTYDLRVERRDAPPIAVEVVRATDRRRQELISCALSLIERSYPSLTQEWHVHVRGGAHVRTIERTIEPI